MTQPTDPGRNSPYDYPNTPAQPIAYDESAYEAPAPAVAQLAVRPRRHHSHVPQLTWNGTITRSPSGAAARL